MMTPHPEVNTGGGVEFVTGHPVRERAGFPTVSMVGVSPGV